MKQLILVGAGHAHAEVLHQMASRPLPDTRVLLVSPHALAPYSGMVPGWLAGHYEWEECCIDFRHLCQQAGVEFAMHEVKALDPDRSQLMLDDGQRLDYDWLSLNHGSTLHVPVSDQMLVLPMRPLAELHARWGRLLQSAGNLPAGSTWRVLMVGGGAAGVESMLAAWRRLPPLAAGVRIEFILVTQGRSLMPGHSTMASNRLRTHLQHKGIAIRYGFTVNAIHGNTVISTSGEAIETDAVLWASGAEPHDWARNAGLDIDRSGFIRIDDFLRSRSHPNIFAVGDCASREPPLPKAGVVAVRMGPVLAHNLAAAIEGGRLHPYQPQRRHLALIGTGGRHAVASWGALGWEGDWVWRWKENIDRRFVEKYSPM